jgi:hypothetical protein
MDIRKLTRILLGLGIIIPLDQLYCGLIFTIKQ